MNARSLYEMLVWGVTLTLGAATLLATRVADAAAPSVNATQARAILFLDDPDASELAKATCAKGSDAEVVRCLIVERYAGDTKAQALALRLYDGLGTVAGLEDADTRVVGWRGEVVFEPALPIGKEKREHLRWVVQGFEDIDGFFAALAEHAQGPLPYRWGALELRFYTTPGRTTPSAYAWDWKVAYNVRGSLLKSERTVRETLFHEIFHLNDQEHGQWSAQRLTPIFDRIVARCTKENGELSTPCLKPYAPSKTKVKGGTYYAFQPGNGVGEYAAELALRYFLEQRAYTLDAKKKPEPFKCASDDNAESWTALADEFFGGVDLVPACAP